MKVDPREPHILENGQVQMRLLALMLHPDYNLNKAFNGAGPIGPNRNEELESMETIDIILDAKRTMEQLIEKGGTQYTTNYAYAGFMANLYDHAVLTGAIDDPSHNRAYYVSAGKFYNGSNCLRRYKAGITENEHFDSAD